MIKAFFSNLVGKVCFDLITMESRLETTTVLGFDEKSILETFLGITAHWDFKPNIDYLSRNTVNLTTIAKIHSTCDANFGSILNGVREPILFCFALDKPPE